MRIAAPARVLGLAALAAGAGSAQALTVDFQCTGYRMLTLSSTPQEAHVKFEGHEWALVRVRAGGEMRYVDWHDGVTVITRGRTMSFQHGNEKLACKLLSDALDDERPLSAPASGPAAAASRP